MDEEKLEQRVQSLCVKSHHCLADPATETEVPLLEMLNQTLPCIK